MNHSRSVTSMKKIYKRFKENIIRNSMIQPGDRVLISMSAGKDSIALFHLFENLKKEIGFDTGIFHLNHMMRGDESDNDEILLRELSEKYNIPFYCRKHDFRNADAGGLSFEEAARNIRYSMIKEICVNYNYNKTATAHNYDDNAETVLMRFFSGTGIRGLGGIHPMSDDFLRPLLIFTADEIYQYLNEENIRWREDSSNSDEKYLRNFVRNSLLPLVVSKFPDAVKNINRLSDHSRENENLLSNLIFEKYQGTFEVGEKFFILFMNMLPEDESVIKFILSRLIYRMFGEKLSAGIIDEILRKYRSKSSNRILYENSRIIIEKKFNNNQNIVKVYDTNDKIRPLTDWSYLINLHSENRLCEIYIDEIKRKVTFERVDNNFYAENMLNINYVFISMPVTCNFLIIRNRRRGDRIILENGVKKIKDLMIEKKLDTLSKSIVPLVEVDNSIAAFIPGIVSLNGNRVSCGFKVQDNSKKIIAIYGAEISLV